MTQYGQYIDSREFLSEEMFAVESSTARWHAKVKNSWKKRKKWRFATIQYQFIHNFPAAETLTHKY